MKPAWLIGGLIAVVCVVVGVYYLIPGIYHPFTSSDPNGLHLKHAIVFFGLAIVSLVGARFAANAQKAQ
ncbi:MAG TPA: hypothetical protein VF808_05020 [Ktedonobacterales bacterium]